MAEAPSDISGLEVLQRIISGALPAPGIGKSLNFWIAEADEGRVVFEGEPGPESANPMGMAHGGWALTLIDSACGCAARSVLLAGVGYTTLETRGNMTKAIKPNSGIYRCQARLMAKGRMVMTSDATIVGPDGKLYAHGASTLLVLRERWGSRQALRNARNHRLACAETRGGGSMSETETPDRAGVMAEWRKSWRTVSAAAIGSATGLILFSFIVSIFVRPQTEELGWTRGEAALSSFSTIAAGLLAPLFGRLSDVWGVRPVILLGGIGYAAAAFGLSVQNGNLLLYYGLMFLLVFLGLGTSSITWGRVVSADFRKSRGFALSVALSAVTVTAALMPIAIVIVMGQAGWRGAWVLIGGVGLAGSLLGLLVLPKETGRQRSRPEKAPIEAMAEARSAGLGDAVRQPAFWCLVLGMTIINIPSGGIMSSMAAIVADKGFNETDVAQVLSAFAVSVFLGRAITGVCLDRFSPPVVAFAAMGIPAVGCALLAGGPVIVGVMIIGIVLAGLSQGAEGDVGPFLVSRYFGLASFGAIMGAVNAGVVGGTGIGGLLFGFVFDSYKSYDLALWVGAGCFLFGALLFLGVGFAPERRQKAPEGSDAANQIGV